MDYSSAVNKIRMRRKADIAGAKALYVRLLQADPKLYETEKAIRSIELDEALGKKTDSETLSRLKAERLSLLKRAGAGEDALFPSPRCAICGDTGMTGGKICVCALKLITDSAQNNIEIPLRDFSEFKPEMRKEAMQAEKLCGLLKIMAEKYPLSKKKTVLLMGGAGVGKTFLAGCFANAVKKKGGSVMAMTAFGFQNRMLSYHTAPMETKLSILSPALDCSLLVIDDLGKESMLKNVTSEYLYLVINERLLKDRYTFITTNLAPERLAVRYGESTLSRLLSDKSIALTLSGEDLRLMKKE